MSDESNKWDPQWRQLLTHCHGADVPAEPGFKSRLLEELKAKTAQYQSAQSRADEAVDKPDDANWTKLLQAAYVPCYPENAFKSSLLAQLKERQTKLAAETTQTPDAAEASGEEGIRTLLTRSYQPVAPRKEFESRLLDNLKERQRHTTSIKIRQRRRTIFMSAASSIAAAAMVAFVIWAMPVSTATTPSPMPGNLHLPIPDDVMTTAARFSSEAAIGPQAASDKDFASEVMPASFDVVPAAFGGYRVADVFTGPVLPERAFALQNLEMESGGEWAALAANAALALAPGMRFRSSGGMGHMEFSDGSLLSMSPDSLLAATPAGLTVEEGFVLVGVPDSSSDRFRLHFAERDIAVEPGTDLAVMVEPKDNYAVGGAPAPMVMVVDRQDSPGGFALAKGKNGVGPLLAKQIYRLDNYVTPDLPGRTLCDTECQDLEKFYKAETPVFDNPPASLVGGFAGHDRDLSYAATVLTPIGFKKQGDKWVAEGFSGQPTVRLKYLSDAYFGFADARRDLARELSLGGEVILDGKDGYFYEIYK